MPRFVVRHQHSPESCPASDPAMGAMLLNHLSPPNAARYGVVIQGEAVVRGAHTLSSSPRRRMRPASDCS
jgi:hypothetical protein